MDKKERQALVMECRASGMTAKAWCEAKGIGYRQYVDWATKLNREEQNEVLWADITINNEEQAAGEIRLNCGKWTICVGAGFSPALLADVLRVVDALC